jgi:serine/threonine protein kinase
MEEEQQTNQESEELFINELKNGLLSQNFEYEEKLGKGIKGKVFKVRHKIDEKEYAIKILQMLPQADRNVDVLRLDQRQELNILTHNNLCRRNIIDYNSCFKMSICNNLYLCIQMELCGISLAQFVYKNAGGINFIKAVGQLQFCEHVFLQILRGLDAIHKIGWIHQDIQTGNIVIRCPDLQRIDDCCVKIIDFGHATEIQLEINKSNLNGNPQGGDILYKDDIFLAGFTMYSVYLHLLGRDTTSNQLLDLINWLMRMELEERPTAAEALEWWAGLRDLVFNGNAKEESSGGKCRLCRI